MKRTLACSIRHFVPKIGQSLVWWKAFLPSTINRATTISQKSLPPNKRSVMARRTSESCRLIFLSLGTVLVACQPQPAPEPDQQASLENDEQKTAYSLGASNGAAMARSLEQIRELGLEMDQALVLRGLEDALNDELQLDQEERERILLEFGQKAQQLAAEKQQRDVVTNKAEGDAFLAENAKDEGVTVLESGLQYKIIEEGDTEGGKPSRDDTVVVHYAGTLIDGTEFDSSYPRGEPAEFGVGQVITGWTEALQLMNKGAKWQLFIPSDLAYGETANARIPANSVLLFDVELLDINGKE